VDVFKSLSGKLINAAKAITDPREGVTLAKLKEPLDRIVKENGNMQPMDLEADGHFYLKTFLTELSDSCLIMEYFPGTKSMAVFIDADPEKEIAILSGIFNKYGWVSRRFAADYEAPSDEHKKKMDNLRKLVEAGSLKSRKAKYDLEALEGSFAMHNKAIARLKTAKKLSNVA